MRPDPLGFAAGDTNLDRYVGNNPTNETDPSGLLGRRRGGRGGWSGGPGFCPPGGYAPPVYVGPPIVVPRMPSAEDPPKPSGTITSTSGYRGPDENPERKPTFGEEGNTGVTNWTRWHIINPHHVNPNGTLQVVLNWNLFYGWGYDEFRARGEIFTETKDSLGRNMPGEGVTTFILPIQYRRVKVRITGNTFTPIGYIVSPIGF